MKIFNISEIRKIRKGFIVTCLTRYRKVAGRLETWKNPVKYMEVTGLVPDSEEPDRSSKPTSFLESVYSNIFKIISKNDFKDVS
ncbi:unnamed protein product [Rhizophagus irregularis]|uniref:Uncharacterized protein n=1 Tax=Rhizophagus irregularis TaxID=588596 RepID=A0A915ZL83_9GLOM|nr:unnamed protein product [Rhizophagus irregularis]CAB5381085.1 unnamed protein product [Rhizophagus irregularis]